MVKDPLLEDQITQDVVRIAREYTREQNINDKLYLALVAEGVRLGIARGLEISINSLRNEGRLQEASR